MIKSSVSEFQSFQLPFGSSVCRSVDRLVDQFLKRLESGLEVITEDRSFKGGFQRVISGYGLGEFGLPLPSSSLGSWSLLSSLISKNYQVSNSLKFEELSRHQYLFPQLIVCISAYLKS